MTTIPNVPEQNPNQSELWLPRVLNPYVGLWFNTTEMKGVPENIVGWMVSAGWEVTNIIEDTRTVPSTKKFDLMRPEKMKPWEVLLSLCNHYTVSANEARAANQVRYNQIVANWTQMIDTSHEQFNAQTADHNAQVVMYLGDLDAYMDAIEALIAENQAQIIDDANLAKASLANMDLRVSDLETNAQSTAVQVNTLLTTQRTNLQTYINDYNAKLLELDQNYAAHLAKVLAEIAALGTVTDAHIATYEGQFTTLANNYNAHLGTMNSLLASVSANVDTYIADVTAILNSLEADYFDVDVELDAIKAKAGTLGDQVAGDYDAILAQLLADYEIHAGITRGLLNGLGSTELARINEQFAANLSSQIQQLTSSGLSQSGILADVIARNHRDRDEQIQALNDRLMREKLENEHRLYGQQFAMRGQTIEGTVRINAIQQEVLRYQASLVTGTYSLLQELRNRVLAGKQAMFAARDANHKFWMDVRNGLYAQLQDVRLRTIEATDRVFQIRDVFAKWKNGETNRLYEQLQQVESQYLASIDRLNAARQDVTRGEISQRDQLLQQLQTALGGLLSGRERYATLLLQNASTLADHKHRAIAERMNTAIQRLDGIKMTGDQSRTLMAYQLDERNKLLIGLYSFVERREDAAPEWRDMSTMIAGLGDSGGGWLSPN